MNYIIMDLEWNQSNTGTEKEVRELPFEIIEIGAIKLNKDHKMIDEFSELIKPVVYKEMHHITRKLIHLQIEELEKGRPFPEVMGQFLNWCGEDYMFCTWGPLDLTELQRNIRFYGMKPLCDRPMAFLDVQKLFSIVYEDSKTRRALEYAVDFLEMEKDIPFHRAFSDAYYTAKILAGLPDPAIEKLVSYDVFMTPKTREDEIHVVFDSYAKYISREFADKTEALADREVSSTKCYLCHKNLRKKIKWFSPNGRHYYSLAYCDKHGYMKGKIRIRKAESDRVYVVKTLKFISEEDAGKIAGRQDRARELRRQKRHQQKKKES